MSPRVRYGGGKDKGKDRRMGRVGPSTDKLGWEDGPFSLLRPVLTRIVVLQALATVALASLFYLNWSMKPNAFEVRVNAELLPFSVGGVTLVGLIVGAVLCTIPSIWDKLLTNWKKVFGFEYTTRRGLLIAMGIVIIIALVAGLPNFLWILMQLFIAFFYLAALLFGVYGIWRMKGTHIITSGMFTIFTALSSPSPSLQLWAVLAFGLCFLLFMELSSSAMRQYGLAMEEFVPVKFQTRMVDRYLLNLGLFTLLALGLSLLALWARVALNFVSPIYARQSLEIQGFMGLLLPAAGALVLVVLLRYAIDWRADRAIRATSKDKKVLEGKSPWAIARALLRNEG